MRLLTLIGPGGVGKTRLALQAVTGMTDILHRAVYFVPLASLSTPAGIALEIVNTLDASDGGALPMIDTIRAALRDRPSLIILDNLEHLLPDAAALVGELLASCSSLNLLVTSRAPLHVYGEQRFPVRPLSLTAPLTDARTSTGLEEPEAVRLFMIRARAVDPGFRATESVRRDVTDLCRCLDCLPLAIELAAARVAEIHPRAYLQRLKRQLPVPSGASQDMPARQKTMSAAVRWGYNLLDPNHQAMFRRMAVFSGGFDLDAAEAMAEDLITESSGDNAPSVSGLDLLVELVDASFVQRLTDPSGEARNHYYMLETIKEFGLARAREHGELAALTRRHAQYFLDRVVETNRRLLAGRNLVPSLEYLDSLLPNIRGAMEWSIEHEPTILAQFTRHLMQYWLRRSRILEGIDWLTRAERVASGVPDVEQGWILANLARLRQYTPHNDVEPLFQSALQIALATHDRELQLAVYIGLTLHASHSKRLERAWAAHRAAMNVPEVELIAPRVTQPTFLAAIEALLTAASGEFGRAEEIAREALARAEREGDEIAPGLLHRILAAMHRNRGDLESARSHTLTAHGAYAAVGEDWNAANCLIELAALFLQDHPELSVRLVAAGDRLLEIHGAKRFDPKREPFRAHHDQLRATLGEEGLRELWRKGAAQPWQHLVAEARDTPVDTRPAAPAAGRLPGIGGTLSRREQEVLRLIADGLTDREIAEALGITYRTVTTYVSNILTKLDVPSRTAAVTRAARQGFLDS